MSLEELRSEIDELDRQIVELLNRRMRVSQRVGELKRGGAATDPKVDVYLPDREIQLLTGLERINPGPLSDVALRAIYREILSASRALQRPLRVGYLGPPATFTYEAAQRHFGHGSDFVPCTTIADVFDEAERRAVDYGVVPVENSTGGAVASTLDQLLETHLQICGQVELPVSHFLLSNGQLDQIRRVYSHPQALAQCRRWLAAHLPLAVQIETTSTAAAAELARDPETAAISTESASELYSLPIVARRIEDSTTNVTRFLIIGQHMSGPTGRDRTSIVFAVQHRVGALQDALRALAGHAVNLTRIESRPSRRRLWEYVFFVDLDGHPRDDAVSRALDDLIRSCTFVRVLGAWPVLA